MRLRRVALPAGIRPGELLYVFDKCRCGGQHVVVL